MAKSWEKAFKRLYDLYTSDLSISEIERLVKRDAPGVYDFYIRDVETSQQKKGPLARSLAVMGNLFMAFLHKLTPVRRVFYSLVVVMFIYSTLIGSWPGAGLAFFMLNILLAFELADKLTAKDELEVAREIQMGLMPHKAPRHPHYDIACFSEAAREVGGDYYDFIRSKDRNDNTLVIIGDVSGKGMGAALHMVQVQAILHHLAERYENPRDILSALNRNLRHSMRAGSFFTISMATLNSQKVVHLCRAGHMPLIHYRKNTRSCSEVIPGGIGVGLTGEQRFGELLQEIEMTVEPGDILFLYTDGVVEVMNDAKLEFGEERLKKVIVANAAGTAREIQDAILTSVAKFRGFAAPNDDLTMIVMKAL